MCKKIFKKINKIFKKINKKFKKIISSTILCIRFPFLYPRNRFTGLHYNNWKIIEKTKTLYQEAYDVKIINGVVKKLIKNNFKHIQFLLLKFYHDVFLQIIFSIPTSTELNALDKGWRKAFGIKICKEIKKALIKDGGIKALYRYRITQIKEKWGELCWYAAWDTKSTLGVISKYENISAHTCIDCGKKAIGKTTGYILPYCKECKEKNDIYDFNFEYFENNKKVEN